MDKGGSGSVAVTGDDHATSNKLVRQMEQRIRDLELHLGRKALKVEIFKKALHKERPKKRPNH